MEITRPEPSAGVHDYTATSIFVDDEGDKADLCRAIYEMAIKSWPNCGGARVDEALELLGHEPGALRDAVRRSFFGRHLLQYSKARRRAPIYWQLSTLSLDYSVWLYYHSLNKDTLYNVQNDYVAPKLAHEQRQLDALRVEAGPNPTSTQRKGIEAQEAFVEELQAFLNEVKRVAPLWNPDLMMGSSSTSRPSGA